MEKSVQEMPAESAPKVTATESSTPEKEPVQAAPAATQTSVPAPAPIIETDDEVLE